MQKPPLRKIGDLTHLTLHQLELGLKVVAEMSQSTPETAEPPHLPPELWGLTPEDWSNLTAALYALQMQRMHSTLH